MFQILFFISWLFAASEPLSQGQLETKLKFYKKIKSLEVDFNQEKKLKKLDLILKSSGRMELEPPHKVLWQVEQPAPLSVLFQNNSIEMTSGEGEEKKTQKMKVREGKEDAASQGLLALVAWLRMDTGEISKAYNIKEIGSNEYECLPKNQETRLFEKLVFQIHKNGHLTRLSIVELSGDTLMLKFGTPRVVLMP